MRIDVVSIFPAYLDALGLSLPGKARESGLLDLRVHDLRQWAHDRHRTVDDTPYGGGAGMVMKPEPWGEALDELLTEETVLVVPTPAGEVFTQQTARELAAESHLVFACGRYEGIDQRVIDHAAGRVRVRELSLGDYVLNGGEVAALAVVEAVVRLLPGFMGNPGSLTEESHEAGLLEYPVYTKPPTWRGLDVPDVLRGGDHGAVRTWRREQSVRRTVARRPDLLAAGAGVGPDELVPVPAVRADGPEIYVLQRSAAVGDVQADPALAIPLLQETLEELVESLGTWRTWVVRADTRLVASVRARLEAGRWEIGRLVVAPDLKGRGLERSLLEFVEGHCPHEATICSLVTGADDAESQRAYRKAGYRPAGEPESGLLRLTKKVRR